MLFLRFLCLAVLLSIPIPGMTEIRPIPLTGGANSSFADELPDDRKSGWIDLGTDDLRKIPTGKLTLGKVPFYILGDAETKGKSCIVLSASKQRDYLPGNAEIKLAFPEKANMLYLLHAGAWLNQKKNLLGRITVNYEDGSSREFRVRTGRDAADWRKNSGSPNALRVWTIYNNNSQVSLYVSKFPLIGKPVRSISLSSGDDGVWMIAGISIGDNIAVKPIQEIWVHHSDYPVPTPPDAGKLAAMPRIGVPKNIILIIGDGMGQGAVKYAGLYAHGIPQRLVMEQFPVRGIACTCSADNSVTDSAASGTALSSGYKTNNGIIGMTPQKVKIRTFAEAVRDSGRRVGVVTTDALTGATPGAQFAHVPSRGMASEIAEYALNSRFTILIGSNPAPFLLKNRKDKRDLVQEFLNRGYCQIDDLETLRSAAEKPIFGFIAGWELNTRLLSLISAESFKRLENANGFFIMIEASYPDYGGHGNNPDRTLNGVLMVDFAVKAALDFATRRNDTLIVVTADHETGGIFCAPNPLQPKQPLIGYTSKNHTGAPVDVFAFGPGADNFAKLLDNTDIPVTFARLWNLQLNVILKE